MKRKILFLALVCLLLFNFLVPVGAAQSIHVSIDGKNVSFTQSSGSPFIDSNSRTLVPLRAVMEQYGCAVGWDKDSYTASVTLDKTTVTVPIGKKQISINDITISTDAPAQIKNGRTYLPIRAVLEAFGAAVGWDNSSKTVTVSHPEKAGLRVHFIDVGQADCILVTSGKDAMLIDAGNNEDAETIVAYLRAHGISHLKYAVGTHPHEDHIGSLDTILLTFPVDSLWMPKAETTTKTFEDVLDAAMSSGLTITAPRAGDTFSLGQATITAVNNCTDTTELNNASIMLRLTYGKTSFLFTGDAQVEAEEAALQTGISLDSDVLKVGHHGSDTSSSADFLAAVSPGYAVISCGAGNTYGHPHAETLSALSAIGAVVYRTDTQGNILAVSNGAGISWSNPMMPTIVKPGSSNTAGSTTSQSATETIPVSITYVLNTNTKKFHRPSCNSVAKIADKHREDTGKTRAELIAEGYTACGNCKP